MKMHYWSYCKLCECAMVVCGACGNNCCNGGYGFLSPDSEERCSACPSAYEKQGLEYKEHQEDQPSTET